MPTIGSMDVTLLGYRVLADGQVKMKSFGWVLIQSDWHPYKKEGHLDTNTEERQRENTGRTPSTSQGTPETTRSWERTLEESLPLSLRRTYPAHALISDL